MHACCISGLPSFSLFRPFGFLVLLRLLSFSHSHSLYSPFSRSLTLYSIPFGSAVLSGVYGRGYVCATKRTGASARTNSRCIVVSECRKVTVQSASKLCSYNLELISIQFLLVSVLFVSRVRVGCFRHPSNAVLQHTYNVSIVFTNALDVT